MIAVIADLASTYTAVRTKFGGKIDYGKILNHLAQKPLFKMLAYGIQNAEDVPQFIDALYHLGFIPMFEKDRNWSVQIALDCIAMMDKVNHYVFVTDNRELEPLIKMLWDRSYKITLFTTAEKHTWPCDNYIELNPLLLEQDIPKRVTNEIAKATQ